MFPSKKYKKVFIAGHNGMVGGGVTKFLKKFKDVEVIVAKRSQLDLTSQSETYKFIKKHKPDLIILAAAKVGGIVANNTYPYDFIMQNMQIEVNVINAALELGVNDLIFLGSSCIYPKLCDQPIRESEILSGYLEPTNMPYAVAKISGIIMCNSANIQYNTNYKSLMPCNLYGCGDNYHPQNSHVIPGLIRRIHEAKVKNHSEVKIWGSGNPLREFLNVDDLVEAIILVASIDKDNFSNCLNGASHINVGSGKEISIKDLSNIISNVIGFEGALKFDTSKPDGTPRKILDISLIQSLGWNPKISLKDGIQNAYLDYLSKIN